MLKFVFKRILWAAFTVFATAFVIFTILYAAPGDPARALLGSTASLDEIEAMHAKLGLTESYVVQLGTFLKNILTLNFGVSWKLQVPVFEELASRLPRTLIIGGCSMVINLALGILLGIFAGVHGGRWQDSLTMGLAMVFIAAPNFWVALMFIILFSVKLGWLPPYGIATWTAYILPVAASILAGIAANARQMRSSMLEVYRADFITTARSKGQTELKVIQKHMLPNAMMPIITSIGMILSTNIAGSPVIEQVFSIPGVGQYLVTGINNFDYPVVRACVLFFATFTSLVMLLVDLVYAALDPRIKARFIVNG
jgi:peptide/nickel transport system permease protein